MTSPTPEAAASGAVTLRSQEIGGIDVRVDRLCRARRHGERLDALVALVAFLRHPSEGVELVSSDTAGEAIGPYYARLALFAAVLERSPERRATFAAAVAAILEATSALSLFAEGGLRNDRGLLVETSDRLARRLLPKPREEHELTTVLPRLFPAGDAWKWVTGIPPGLFQRVCALVPDSNAWRPVRAANEEALCLLAARVTAVGLSQEMRERRNDPMVRSSPYHKLAQSTDRWLFAIDARAAPEELREAEAAWSADVLACRRGNDEVRAHLESSGVSVDIVYALDVIERHLDRMVLLFAVLSAGAPEPGAGAVHALLRVLVRGRLNDRSLRSLLRESLGLISRKVIERTSETGEHYITTTRAQWGRMWLSAAGGGLVTTFTAALKVLVAHSHFPILVEFCLSGSNYAISFVLIQLFGFTLATKQPAMTAATLASILERGSSAERSEALAVHIARIVRSQLAAAFGNILAVSAGAFVFVHVYQLVKGRPFLSPETSADVLRSLDPAHSGTIAYAAITGVVLWISGIVAGWVSNWVVYRRLPQAIAEHRLGERFGPHRMQSASRWFSTHIAGLSGSVALGFLLAAVPALGKASGLPLDVRHVTLSTGQLVLAAATLGGDTLHDPHVRGAVFGIAVIFVLNLGTSFLLALAVAARARNATAQDMRDLGAALVRHAVRRPLDFLVPRRATAVQPGEH